MTVASLEDLTPLLAAWLGRQTGEDVTVEAISRPAAGQSNDTVICQIIASGRPTQLVVRRQTTANSIFREPDVLREARVLHGLSSTAVPVPRVLWTEPDPGVLGAPFFVMEHVAGRVPAGKPSIHSVGWLPTLTERQRSRLWASALEVLVAVHDVAWRQTHDFLVGPDPEATSVRNQLDQLLEWYHWTVQGRSYPITDSAADYLGSHIDRVAATQPVLLWGDPRVGNMMFTDECTVAAALDWEVASVGPAERDMAHWLFFDEFATEAIGIERLPGWPDREATVARYESSAGRSLGDLLFFDIFQALFMATTLIRQADARVARGLAPRDTRMGQDNTVTQMLARRLGLPTPELSTDYLAHRGVR